MTADGAKSYGFDFDNRLVSASGGVALAWDPTSRLLPAPWSPMRAVA
jgi:hypothetical protein